ncbi:hypothetical protein [Streptomyces sp. NBC_01367]|uniref:hypothetical protein n=1 Tax=Streptomyces sp. NBC_01367 TaxID=2903841 RepID=UPI0032554409
MMHGTLAVQLPPTSLLEATDAFGNVSPDPEPVRVEVRVRACLSFADLLGLLAFTSGLCLLDEELSDDDAILDGLQYALLMTGVEAMEAQAEMATSAYHGVLRGRGISMDYMRRLGTAVTRVFGVTA